MHITLCQIYKPKILTCHVVVSCSLFLISPVILLHSLRRDKGEIHTIYAEHV